MSITFGRTSSYTKRSLSRPTSNSVSTRGIGSHGKASLQLTSINNRTGHIYAKKTVPLRKEGTTENAGSITLSVFCLKPGETAPNVAQKNAAAAEEAELDGDEDLTTALLGQAAPASDGGACHIYINIYRVEDLAKMGYWNPNPFVTVEFAGVCVRTTPAYDFGQYTWNDCARISCQQPICEDTILVKLWHKGSPLTLSSDQLLVQGLISFSELRNNSLPVRWFPLYGWDPEEAPDVNRFLRRARASRQITLRDS